MALSLLKPKDVAASTGLGVIGRHHIHRDNISDASRADVNDHSHLNESSMRNGKTASPFQNLSPLSMFPPSLLASQMFDGLSIHASLGANPVMYAQNWFPNPTSPPPTPVNHKVKRGTSDYVSSSCNVKKPRKRVKSSPDIAIVSSATEDPVPNPPLSPPTSGSSPQSNGSGQEVSCNKNGDKVFTCDICKRSFGYKHVLQNHERTHTGEKPFECQECHKRFTRDHHLKTHMRLHTGEKPYHCTHCDRQFVQVANLRRHLRVHTGERPYGCEVCSSRFSDSNQLKAHILIHRGEKPFTCPYCNGKYRRRHHLIHHKCVNKPNGIYNHVLHPDLEDDDSGELEIDEDGDSLGSSPTQENDVYESMHHYPEMRDTNYITTSSADSYNLNNNSSKKVRERKSRDIRRVVRIADSEPLNLVSTAAPEQTEPEDLSMPKRNMKHHNNNHELRNQQLTMEITGQLRTEGEMSFHHPKFRRHIQLKINERIPLS